MGLEYNMYLNSRRIYGCKNCKTHLSNHDDIISRVRLHISLCPPPLTSRSVIRFFSTFDQFIEYNTC